MRGSSGLVDGVVRSVGGVGLCVDGLVGPDVRVAEKIAGRDGDVIERGDIVNSSQVILRSLSEIRRFATVSGAKRREDERRLLRCHFRFPFSVLTHAEYVCFTNGSQSLGGLLQETEMREAVAASTAINPHTRSPGRAR